MTRIKYALFLVLSLCLLSGGAHAVTITVSSGVDAWVTGPGTTVDLPPLPAGFFGSTGSGPSDPVPAMPGFDLTGHPFPDQFGIPDPFPPDQLPLDLEFVDPHGNIVGPDSVHAVGVNVKNIDELVPFNFDTVVRRNSPVVFTDPGDPKPVPIEMTWLSLRSVAPIEVTFGGGSDPTDFDIFVGLSDTLPQVAGRMLMTADDLTNSSATGQLDLGLENDQVDQDFENADTDPFLGFQDYQDAFQNNPAALGLPVLFQLRFINTTDPEDLFVFDDPTGFGTGGAVRTASVFHNQSGTFAFQIPEPSSLSLALWGLIMVCVRSRRRNLLS